MNLHTVKNVENFCFHCRNDKIIKASEFMGPTSSFTVHLFMVKYVWAYIYGHQFRYFAMSKATQVLTMFMERMPNFIMRKDVNWKARKYLPGYAISQNDSH